MLNIMGMKPIWIHDGVHFFKTNEIVGWKKLPKR